MGEPEQTFENSLEGVETWSHAGFRKMSVPSRGMAGAKALRWDVVRAGEKGRKEERRAEGSGGRVRQGR